METNASAALDHKVEEKFSPAHYVKINGFIFLWLIFMTWVICTVIGAHTVWHAQIPVLSWIYAGEFIVCFVSFQLFGNFVEWPFHRYMLHSPLIPGFESLFIKHERIHHLRTPIIPTPPNASEQRWLSGYPIVKAIQYASSFFPDHSYLSFMGFASVFVIPLQWLLPTWPIISVSIASVLWSLTMYEFLHDAHHRAEASWKELFKKKNIGDFLQLFHSFHAVHHVVTSRFKWNMNISGFLCGIPLADWFFGTLILLDKTILDGEPVNKMVLVPPRPRWFIRWLIDPLDRIADRRSRAYYPRS